jgi:hypothetical protein
MWLLLHMEEMAFGEELAAVASQAICGLLANGGNAAAATFIVNGLRVPATAVPSAAAGLGLLALNYGCNFNPDQVKPGTEPILAGCRQAGAGGRLWVKAKRKSDGAEVDFTISASDPVVTIVSATLVDIQLQPEKGVSVVQRTASGYQLGMTVNLRDYGYPYVVTTGPCAGSDGGLPQPPIWDTPVTSPGGCQMTVNLDSFVVEPDGSFRPVLKIRPATSSLATGGVIGGCNFQPVIYVGGPGGGGGGGCGGDWWTPDIPGPDGPNGEPWWWKLLMGGIDAIAEAAIQKLVDALFAEKAPAALYRLTSCCEVNDKGEPIDKAVEVQIPEAPVFTGLRLRLDALAALDQGLKDFRQPICYDKPVLRPQGEWVSVRFLSDERSPDSGMRLEKLFRYLDQSSRPLVDHVAHWENFTWEAGPVIVCRKSRVWGVQQVWAASAEEGKRVILHAAEIAGVDTTQDKGEWIITGTSDPRYGKTGRMRVKVIKGLLSISKRDGPTGPPTLATPIM